MLLSLLLGIFLVLGILAFSTYLVGKTPELVKLGASAFFLTWLLLQNFVSSETIWPLAWFSFGAVPLAAVVFSSQPEARRIRDGFAGVDPLHLFAFVALAVSASLLLVHEGKTRARAESAATHELARP